MSSNDIEQHRQFWADIAKQHGWYVEPFYIQVWRDYSGNITDSVSYSGITEDVVIQDGRDCDHADYDDYFDRCPDCGLEGVVETIEAEQAELDRLRGEAA